MIFLKCRVTLSVSSIQLPHRWRGGMFPRRCAVEGLFPQHFPAQSVQSSGGDERWGLGGNATTHFTGKTGSRSGCTPIRHPGIRLICVFVKKKKKIPTTHVCSGGGGQAAASEEQTEVESRICSAFNISSAPSTCSQAEPAASCPAVPASSTGIRGLRTGLWHFEDAGIRR